jgi:hypothetical protein
MMKKEDAVKNIIIDEFFGEETDNSIELDNSSDIMEFKNKLDSAMTYMSSADINNIETVFDIQNIIDLAETAKQKKKQKKDIAVFTLIGLIMQFLMVIAAFKFGSKTIFYFQIFLWTNIPLLIIPFIYKFNRGGSNI